MATPVLRERRTFLVIEAPLHTGGTPRLAYIGHFTELRMHSGSYEAVMPWL